MPKSPAACIAYVGARTTVERNARGDGLNVYRVDSATGRFSHLQLVADLINPTFLAFDRTERFLYAVHGDRSEVSSFEIDPEAGTLRLLGQVSTQGRNPVHLAVDPSNRFVVIANHITSTIALLPRRADGSLGDVIDLRKLEGPIGPHRVEQPFAKPHQVEFDPSGRFIVVPDKGLDRVFTLSLDADRGKLGLASEPAIAREGSGPRHVAFGPEGAHAYVVNELDSTVAAYRFDRTSGRLEPFQIVPALPDSFTGDSRASEIAVSRDGRFLYASNRGFDSIAIFRIDRASGRLTSIGFEPSQGRTPRFFALDPTARLLFVANEDSDTIVAFAIDQASGQLQATGEVLGVGSPVCILVSNPEALYGFPSARHASDLMERR